MEAHMLEAIVLIDLHLDRPVARVRMDSANKFLTKTALGFSRHRGIALDPTTHYRPQDIP